MMHAVTSDASGRRARHLLLQLGITTQPDQQQSQQQVCVTLAAAAWLCAPPAGSSASRAVLQQGMALLPPLAQHSATHCAGQLLAVVAPLEATSYGDDASSSSDADAAGAAGRGMSPQPAAPAAAKRRHLLPAAVSPAGDGASACPGAATHGVHGVSIFELGVQEQPPPPQHRASPAATAVARRQRLPTPEAVCSLAASAGAGLLAAGAVEGGVAYVWHLATLPLAGPAAGVPAHAAAPAMAPDCMVQLPAAAYRGICFPDVVELCFVLQQQQHQHQQGQHSHNHHHQQHQRQHAGLLGCSSPDNSSRTQHRQQQQQQQQQRVLLVGCCSLGSVAVWDVAQRTLLFTVHSPELQLSSLVALPQATAAAAATAMLGAMKQQGAASAAAAPGAVAPATTAVMLLAQVAQRGARREEAGHAGLLLLPQPRPVLLTSSGMQAGVPLLSDGSLLPPGQHQQQPERGAAAGSGGAAVSVAGTTAVAAGRGGAVAHAWDMLTGKVHLSWRPQKQGQGAAAAGEVLSAVGAVRAPAGGASADATVVLLATSTGQLTLVLV
jgi:hypothetical protein